MKKTLFAVLLAVLMVAGMQMTATAVQIYQFTNQAAWEAAVSDVDPIGLTDFNAEPDGLHFTTHDFGDFTATLFNPVIMGGSIPPEPWTPVIRLGEMEIQARDHNSFTRMSFDTPIASFGLDWRNSDTGNDNIELTILGQSIEFGPQGSGFFGVHSTSLFTNVDLGDSAGGGGALTWAFVDNFRYGTEEAIPTPEPTTVMLLGIGILGLAGGAYRRQKQKNKNTT